MNQVYALQQENYYEEYVSFDVDRIDMNISMIAEYVQKYGNDTLSCLSLESDRSYYLLKCTEGFICYIVIHKVAISVGNPICDEAFATEALNEFENFCKENKWRVCFSSMSESYKGLIDTSKYIVAYYGKEAILDLKTYTTTGKKREKFRAKMKKAIIEGAYTSEYVPEKGRDFAIEKQIEELSKEWFLKKGKHMKFAVGELDFAHPYGRRYFLLRSFEHKIEAIVMLSPYSQGKGYFVDVMRRKPDALTGAMEKLIFDAAMALKKENVSYLSLGIAPLYGIDELDYHKSALEKLFAFLYLKGNDAYDFKSLGQFKNKFQPSIWSNRYVIYDKKIRVPRMAYVLAKSRNDDFLAARVYLSVKTHFLKNEDEKI